MEVDAVKNINEEQKCTELSRVINKDEHAGGIWRGLLVLQQSDLELSDCIILDDPSTGLHRVQNDYRDTEGNPYILSLELIQGAKCRTELKPWKATVHDSVTHEDYAKIFHNAKEGLEYLDKFGFKFPFDIVDNYEFRLRYPVDTETMGGMTKVTGLDSIKADLFKSESTGEEYSIPECKTIEEFEKNFTLPEGKVEPVNEVKVADTDLVEVEPVEEVSNVLNWELDRTGNIILGKEFLYDKHLIKVTTKLTFGENLPKNEEELNKLPDYIYYLSMFDESYVGTDDILKFLKRNGIEFVMSHKLGVHEGRTACIGFAPKDNKWYGWSHRAFYGFTIGDVVADGDLTTSSGYVDEYIAEHPEADLSLPVGYTATNLDKAKRMAIAFADAVA